MKVKNSLQSRFDQLLKLRQSLRAATPLVSIVALLLLLALAASLLGYRLGSFSNLSPIETLNIANSQSLRHIGGAPLNLPYKLLDYLLLHVPFGSLALKARLASMLIGLVCVALFYVILRRWYGLQNAVLSTFLFVTSGWLLHAGRFGSGLILITCAILALVAAGTWLNSNKDTSNRWRLVIFTAVCATVLFIPAGPWLVFALLAVQHRPLIDHLKAANRLQLATVCAIAALAVAFITAALLRHPDQAWQWLGIPHHLPEPHLMATYAAGSVAYLFARGPFMPELWLAHTPLLDAATTGLLLLGVAFYAKRWSSRRVLLLAIFLAIAVVMITLHGPYALAYMAPLVYLIAATGVSYLLRQWNSVFPRNPIAHKLALGLTAVMLLAAATYHVQRYFIAWHHSPDTQQAYQMRSSAMPLDLLQ